MLVYCLSEADGTDSGTASTSEAISENSSMADLKSHSGSMTSMNSLSTLSSGIGSTAAAVSDHPDKIEVLKQKKESMEEGIKKYGYSF